MPHQPTIAVDMTVSIRVVTDDGGISHYSVARYVTSIIVELWKFTGTFGSCLLGGFESSFPIGKSSCLAQVLC